jgi:protein phosphatase
MAGAAQSGPPQQLRSAARQNSPAGRASRQLRRTAPQDTLPEDDDPRWASNGQGDFADRPDMTYHGIPTLPAGRPYRRPESGTGETPAKPAENDDEDGDWPQEGRHRGRRRWPVVPILLGVLVLALAGGAFAGWQYTQSQYYIGVSNGSVAVFQGVNSSFLGIGLSSKYQDTGIPLAQLSIPDQSAIKATISLNSVALAQKSVSDLRGQQSECSHDWNALAAWQVKNAALPAQVTAWSHKPPKTRGPEPTVPPAPQTPTPGNCGPASAYGITAAQLPAGTTNTTAASAATQGTTPTMPDSATPAATTPAPRASATRPTAAHTTAPARPTASPGKK